MIVRACASDADVSARPSLSSAAAEPVVPLVFPVTAGVGVGDENRLDVLRILVAELGRHAQLHRKAVARRQRLAIVAQGQQRLRVQRGGHVDTGVIVVGAFETDVLGTRVRADDYYTS